MFTTGLLVNMLTWLGAVVVMAFCLRELEMFSLGFHRWVQKMLGLAQAVWWACVALTSGWVIMLPFTLPQGQWVYPGWLVLSTFGFAAYCLYEFRKAAQGGPNVTHA